MRTEAFDRAFFRLLGMFGQALGLRDAKGLGENWTLDLVYILLESIEKTPYGQSLSFCSPLLATVALTTCCGSKCLNCYSNSVKSDEHLPLNAISKLCETRIPIFLLTGGEPLEHPQFAELVSIFIEHGKQVVVCTSAFSQKLEKLICANPNKLSVLLAVWGDRDRHNYLRGCGTFELTARRVRQLVSLPVLCSINCVVSEPSLSCFDGLENLLDGIAQQVHRLFLTRTIIVGRNSSDMPQLTTQLLQQICRRRELCEVRLGRKLMWSIPELPYVGVDKSFASRVLDIFGIKAPKGCAAGRWTIHIDHKGQLAPCFAQASYRPEAGSIFGQLTNTWSHIKFDFAKVSDEISCLAEDRLRLTQLPTKHPSSAYLGLDLSPPASGSSLAPELDNHHAR